MVDDIGEGSKSYDDLENNVYDGIQNLELTTLDNVEGSHGPVDQYNRMTLRSSRKSKENLAEAKSLNSRESRSENPLAMSTLETVSNYIYTVGLEKIVLPVPPTKINVPTTFTEAMNSEYSEEWLNAMKLELEIIKGNEVAVRY